MAELTIALGGATATAQPVAAPAPASTPAAPAVPPPAAAAVPPGAAQPQAGRGPWNNWGQVISRQVVQGKPKDFDHKRGATREAPLGYLTDGTPFSPYGVTPNGRVRREPRPSMAGRDEAEKAQAGTLGQHRLAPGELKAPASVIGLYGAIDESHRRLNELVDEVRRQHPESKYQRVPHPKAVGEGALQHTDPIFGEGTIGDFLGGTTGAISKWLGDPEAKPNKKTLEEASHKISTATKFYGVSSDPKTLATVAALVAVFMCFLPAIICGIGKLIDKVRGKEADGGK